MSHESSQKPPPSLNSLWVSSSEPDLPRESTCTPDHCCPSRLAGNPESASRSEARGARREWDLLILGGGSAAFAAAIRAVDLGARVAVVESEVIGGTCLNRGCIPSKSLLRAAEIYHLARHQPYAGLEIHPGRVDLQALMAQKDTLLEAMRKEKYWDVLAQYPEITYLPHRARFVGPHEVAIDGEIHRAHQILIATGARPRPLAVPGVERVSWITSREALELRTLPASLVILGGRFVALEMGQLYARLGTRVTILQRSPRILPQEEEALALRLQACLEAEGIEIHTGVEVLSLEQEGEERRVRVRIQGAERVFRAQTLLMATGIQPNTGDLGCEAAGVALDVRGAVQVNEYLQTSVPHIWAAGDVIGRMQLVTTAAHEGAVAAENALTGARRTVDYTAVPHAVFTDPNLARVGLTEAEARQRGLAVECRSLEMAQVPRARAVHDTRGLIKMVAEAGSRRILGVHILAPQAAEIIHLPALMIQHGMTVEDAARKIDVYPTFSEAVKLVAQSFTRDLRRLTCCAE